MSAPAPASVAASLGPRAQTIRIDLGDRSYPILIGAGLLHDAQSWVDLPRAATAVVVSNVTVAPLYLSVVKQALAPHYARVLEVVLPDGEAHKDGVSLNAVFDHLLAQACDRRTVLFALGGGVIGDLTGFAAACYMRGVPFVQVPTTLLAQVDSSVGGKTAINHPLGKNMIGAFHQPVRVLCDLDVLRTLPDREYSAGLAEVIKYGPIADAEFLGWIEQHLPALMARDPAALAHAVRRSCEIKALVVGQDERESGLRAILNFGHTFGHAIEAGLGYGKWLHGEAVGCGMVIAANLSKELGGLSSEMVSRIVALIEKAALPIRPPRWPVKDYLEWMSHDKKSKSGKVRYVVLRSMGSAQTQIVDDGLISKVLEKAIA